MSEKTIIANYENLLIKLFEKIDIYVEDNIAYIRQNDNSQSLSLTCDDIYIIMKTFDNNVQLQAIQACRMILGSKESTLSIDEVISKGIVSLCIEFLKPQYSYKLQNEACWIITNVAAGTSEHTQYIINQGAVPLLVKLLKSPSPDLVKTAVWALRNIAGDGPVARDLVLQEKALPLLIRLVKPDQTSISFVQIIIGTLLSLFQHKNPRPSFDMVKDALPLLSSLLLKYSDEKILGDTCLALSYLSEGPNENIQAVIECGVVPKLIELLASSELTILSPALRTVGNIVTGNDIQTDTVVAHGGLRFIRDLLYHKEDKIVKEAAWTISNITAGNVDQIQHVIDADVITPLIQVMQKVCKSQQFFSGDCNSQHEAAWAVTNLTSSGTIIQIAHLMNKQVLEPFCNLLMSKNWKCVVLVLNGINHILTTAQEVGEVGRVAMIIKDVGGLDKLKALQKHENDQVHKNVTKTIDLFFSKLTSQNSFKSKILDIYTPY